MKYSGIVFFDYDGTLTEENENIFMPTAKSCEAIKMLHENGYCTILATGRMKPLTTQVEDLFDGFITSDGAYAEFMGEQIINKLIDESLLSEVMEYMESHDIYYALENQECAYTNGTNNSHFLDVLDHFKLSRDLYRPISEAPSIFANKMIISYNDESKADEMAKVFDKRLTIKAHRFCLSADLDAYNVTKACGVKAIVRKLGINYKDTYAFGDGENDVLMLQNVAHPIAMGIHSKKLDNIAEFITHTVGNDGIYHALKNYYKII